ncbi:hypothetical protein [Nocardia rhizosphaerae]|uniref:Transmembrane protein n=1 Tax=Nocardia rhizosphaerae TaxID=1691571 RepID=A0ABV8LDM9_9NOCA
MVDDVEKRWSNGGEGGQVARYLVAVIVSAALVAAVTGIWAARRSACAEAATTLCDTPAKAAVLFGPAVILLLGGLGAFARTYRQWRRGQNWPLWQGAGWFLFLLMTAYLAIGAGAAAR